MRLLAVVMSRVRCCGRPIGIEHAAKAVEPAEKVTEVKSKDKNIAAAIEGNNLTMEEKKILGNHTEACLARTRTWTPCPATPCSRAALTCCVGSAAAWPAGTYCPFEQVNVKDRHKKSTYNGYFYT
uniref:Uncharacterized protein LOC116938963 isoform X3 n=1 Tax=Petromyzon marinus TaxID=7757 RepID=A0AAJ7SNC7_PETMA|nr:uncharacterized protein LOC116938963 isoform X3 [Petromyzon marinus]